MSVIRNFYIREFKKLFDSNNFDFFLKNHFKYNALEQKETIKELILLYKKNEINNFQFCKKEDFFHPFLSIYLNDKKNFLFHYNINKDKIAEFIINQQKNIENNKKKVVVNLHLRYLRFRQTLQIFLYLYR